MSGTVFNMVPSNLGDGTQQQNNAYGRQGEQIDGDLHGRFFIAASRKNVFTANVTAKTIKAITSAVASQLILTNPANSGVLAEIMYTDIGFVLPTAVVDTIAWYYMNAINLAAGSPTAATALVAGTNLFSARVGDSPNPQCQAGTAYTEGTAITATKVENILYVGAAGSSGCTTMGVWRKDHQGTFIVPPGQSIMVFATTTDYTASAADMAVTWAEWPFM